jgi:hypothetical protein
MLKSELENKRYKVYIDVDDLHSSYFDEQLLTVIEKCNNFILTLTPGSLEKCNNPKDWMRREIIQAIESNCNIIPIYNKGFKYPNITAFPEELKDIPRYQSIEYSNQYHQAAIEKLISFLSKKKKARKKLPDSIHETIEVAPQKQKVQEVTIGKVALHTLDQEVSDSREVSIGKVGFMSQSRSQPSASIGIITFKRI